MRRSVSGVALIILSFVFVSAAPADSSWDESYREHLGFVILIDDEVVAGLVGRDWTLPEVDDEVILFSEMYVFFEEFANWLYRSDGELVQAFIDVERARPRSEDARKASLEGCTVLEYEPLEWSGSSTFPGVQKFSVKIGYTNIELIL